MPRNETPYFLKLVKSPAEGFSKVGHAMSFESVNGLKKDLLVTIIRLDERVETRHFVRIFFMDMRGCEGDGKMMGGRGWEENGWSKIGEGAWVEM